MGGLAQRLRQDRDDYQNAMEGRRGAWATLLSLFRLVYDGGGSTEAYLPARHGDLFDPETYPFLEGRTADTAYTDGPLTSVPTISDDVVEQVLTKLLLLDGQILSYRALDVEQIGSVYEGIMGFMVEKATGPSVGITYRPPRQKITITVVVDAEELIAQAAAKRANWLDERAVVKLKLSAPIVRALKEARSHEDLAAALDNRLSTHTPRVLPTGSLILQPTQERRRSGSHYTPRALTEPIVAEALRPWLESCNGKPTAEQVLALKLCDPAMGSGAFLVALCRYLARWLVAAWEDPEGPGFPPEFRKEWDKDLYARRLIAQRCLYGVDKNPFAVNLAKLSLWLVTLSKELPFTFVDHALKCGDSLVGYSVKEIRDASRSVQLVLRDQDALIFERLGIDRRDSFSEDSRNDEAYDLKRERLRQQIKASEGLRQTADLMVAAFFDATRAKDRAEKQQVYLAMLSGAFQDDALQESIQEIRDRLAAGEKGISPFHWDLEFPEVFSKDRDGFDVFVGNPPFIGGSKISEVMGMKYFDFLTSRYEGCRHHCDIVAYFFRRCFYLLRCGGTMGLISTNTIGQGDTREGGLCKILSQGGVIYSAERRKKWPGLAAVVVSIVHLSKQKSPETIRLDGKEAPRISAYLSPGDIDDSPKRLLENPYFSMGSKIYDQGFLFAESDPACTPIADLEKLLQEHPDLSGRILPYLVGEEINSDPLQKPKRRVICLSDIKEEAGLNEFPILRDIVKEKVMPERVSLGDNPNNVPLKRRWWAFQAHRPELYERVRKRERVLCISGVGRVMAFTFCPSSYIYSHAVIVFDICEYAHFGLLQSRAHDLWARYFASSMKDDLRYTASDCYETFPFPSSLRDGHNDCEDMARSSLDIAGEAYYGHLENC